MKFFVSLSISLILIVTFSCIKNEKFFFLKKVDNIEYKNSLSIDTSISAYKICLLSEEYPVIDGYPDNQFSKFNTYQKLKMIEELLEYKGDIRICSVAPMCYNGKYAKGTEVSNIKYYSIQVEALFLINQIYFNDPFEYSPYPILIENNGKLEAIDGKIVSMTYQCYEEWAKQIKKMGIENANTQKLVPIKKGFPIQWYR